MLHYILNLQVRFHYYVFPVPSKNVQWYAAIQQSYSNLICKTTFKSYLLLQSMTSTKKTKKAHKT